MKSKKSNNRRLISKITARVMLVVILLCLSLMLSSCKVLEPGWKGITSSTITYETHNQLLEFIESYNSKNDGFVYTFISFKFDNYDKIVPYSYNLHTSANYTHSLITGDMIINEWYDSVHPFGFAMEMIFYTNDYNAQIRCRYSTRDYNFHEYDEIVIEYVGGYVRPQVWTDETDAKYSICQSDYNEFDNAKDCVDDYYDYMYVYQIKINGKNEVSVKITSKEETNQEKLDEITQLLMNSFVIINTEG